MTASAWDRLRPLIGFFGAQPVIPAKAGIQVAALGAAECQPAAIPSFPRTRKSRHRELGGAER